MIDRLNIPVYRNLAQIPENSRIALYGKGRFGDIIFQLLSILRKDIEVVFWIDSFTAGEHSGLEVVLPQALCYEKQNACDIILITSNYVDQILENLASLTGESWEKTVAIANEKLIFKTLMLEHLTLPGYPIYNSIFIELSSQWCMSHELYGNHALAREPRQLTFSCFKMLVDQVVSNHLTRMVALHGTLVWPYLFDAIQYCKKYDLKVKYFTNGLMLTPHIMEHMKESGVDYLTLGISLVSEKDFSKRHSGKDITRSSYISNLLQCIQYHHIKALPFQLNICFLEPYNQGQAEQDRQGAVREEMVRALLNSIKQLLPANRISDQFDMDDLLSDWMHGHRCREEEAVSIAENLNIGIYRQDPVPFHTNISSQPCGCGVPIQAWGGLESPVVPVELCEKLKTPQIMCDGSVIPCFCFYPFLYDEFKKLLIGQVSQGSQLAAVLRNQHSQGLLNTFKNRTTAPLSCDMCIKGII